MFWLGLIGRVGVVGKGRKGWGEQGLQDQQGKYDSV